MLNSLFQFTYKFDLNTGTDLVLNPGTACTGRKSLKMSHPARLSVLISCISGWVCLWVDGCAIMALRNLFPIFKLPRTVDQNRLCHMWGPMKFCHSHKEVINLCIKISKQHFVSSIGTTFLPPQKAISQVHQHIILVKNKGKNQKDASLKVKQPTLGFSC